MALFAMGLVHRRKAHQTPHPGTISRWACKVGLYKLQTAQKKHGGWTAIADLSIHVGEKRVLCLLRAQQAVIDQRRALTLADVEAVGLHVLGQSNADTLRQLLVEDFQRVGFPDALVTDAGTDIVCAARGLNEALGARIAHVEDVSHLCARLLKKELGDDREELDAFSRDLASCAAQVRQTDLAYLAPPAMRHKARFMNLSKLAKWASRVITLLSEVKPGRPRPGQARARGFFAWLRNYTPMVDKILTATTTLDRIQRIVKTRGLNAASALEVKIELLRLGKQSVIAKRLRIWVDKQLALATRLGRPLLVTSDIIESLFGRWKSVIGYHRSAELTTSVLLLPALCGDLTPDLVREALRKVRIEDIDGWKAREIGTTVRSKRAILRLVRQSRNRGLQETAGNPFASSA